MARVLVVDDQETVRDLCARMLAIRGHEVIQADGGLEAVRQYELAQPDVVLLDVIMPGMDGLATLAELRKLDPDVRVAMLTSTSERATVMRALRLGAKDYVLKPFHGRRLAEAVEKLVADGG